MLLNSWDPNNLDLLVPLSSDYSAIEWVMKRSHWDTLRISHRLPDRLSGLVNDFADYGGLKSAPEIADRRLTLIKPSDIEYRQVIEPDEVIT